jgi:hypothetical protein
MCRLSWDLMPTNLFNTNVMEDSTAPSSTLKIEAADSSKMSVPIQYTTWYNKMIWECGLDWTGPKCIRVVDCFWEMWCMLQNLTGSLHVAIQDTLTERKPWTAVGNSACSETTEKSPVGWSPLRLLNLCLLLITPPPLDYINQSKVLVTVEGYHSQH